jgi:RNA polymerase sigma-70 factor (sigma-E family)
VSGDSEQAGGFAAFVRTQTPALLRTAYLLTGSAHEAEELVQDTLVRLYPKWQRVAAADVPIAYVRRAMVNTFLNDRRRPARAEIAMDVLPEPLDRRDRTGGAGGAGAGARNGDPAAAVADRDLAWRLLATLPDRQRAALVMRYFHDLPDDEIARSLDCRAGTVRSLISRGLASLRPPVDGIDPAPSAQRRFA